MKIFVTGAAGQLGQDVTTELEIRGHTVISSDIVMDEGKRYGSTYISLDITDEKSVKECLAKIRPDAVIHCAAWTAVDAAEEEEHREKVYAINVKGTEHIAKACKDIHAKLIYISTDYVFDGQGERPWEPDDIDYAPLNYYGRTKLEGERLVAETLDKYFIVRIAWVFGKNGKNFAKTMLELGKKYKKLRVVCDQIGTPTYTSDLAKLLADMIVTEKYGYYHATNEGGYISWYAYAKAIFAEASRRGYSEYEEDKLDLEAVTTKEYGQSKALRPYNSRLSKKKLIENGFALLPEWQDALKRYLDELDF